MRYLSDEHLPEFEGENPGTEQLMLLEHEFAEHGLSVTSNPGVHLDEMALHEGDLDALTVLRPKRQHVLPPFEKM